MIQWTINLLTTILLLTGQTLNGQIDTLRIVGGKGFNNFVIGKSTPKKIKNFRNVKFKEWNALGIACRGGGGTLRFRSTKLQNDSLGLTFKFETFHVKAPLHYFCRKKLTKITITKSTIPTDHLVIDKSNRQDVSNIYGPPPPSGNPGYTYYSDKGVAFSFDENEIVVVIHLFEFGETN